MQQHRAKFLDFLPTIQKSKTTIPESYNFSKHHKEVSDIRDFDFRSDAGQRFLRAYVSSGYSRGTGGGHAENIRTAVMSPVRTTFHPSTPMKGAGGSDGNPSPWTVKTPLVPGHYRSPMPRTIAAPTISDFTCPQINSNAATANIPPMPRASVPTDTIEPLPPAPVTQDRAANYSSANHRQRRSIYSILKAGFDQFTPAHLDDLAGRIMEAKNDVDVHNIVDSVRCDPEFPITSFLIDTVFADPARIVLYDQEPCEKVLQLLDIAKVHERHHGQAQRAARLLAHASTEVQIQDIVNEFAEVGASAKDTLTAAIQLLVLGTIRNPTISAEIKKGKQRDNRKRGTNDSGIPAFAHEANRVARHAAPSNPRHRVTFLNTLETPTTSEGESAVAVEKFFTPPTDYQTPSRRGGVKAKQSAVLDLSRRQDPLQAMPAGHSDKHKASTASRSSSSTMGREKRVQEYSDNDREAGSGYSSMYASDTDNETNQAMVKKRKSHASDDDLERLFSEIPEPPRKPIIEDPARGKKPSIPTTKGPSVSTSRASFSGPSTVTLKSAKLGPMPHYELLKKFQLSGKDFKGQYYTITRSQSAYTLPAKNINIAASQLSDLHIHTNTINDIQSVYQYSHNGWVDISEQYYGRYNERTIGKIARHPVHNGLVLTTVPAGTHPTYILERTYLNRQG